MKTQFKITENPFDIGQLVSKFSNSIRIPNHQMFKFQQSLTENTLIAFKYPLIYDFSALMSQITQFLVPIMPDEKAERGRKILGICEMDVVVVPFEGFSFWG